MNETTLAISESGLLKASQVLARLSISQRHLDRLIAAGEFPSPIRLGTRSKRWRSIDVDRYIASLSPAVGPIPACQGRTRSEVTDED